MEEQEFFEQRTDLSRLSAAVEQIKSTIGKVVVGQHDAIDLLIAGILADGHILIEGVPGVAKTLTAKLIAKSIDAKYPAWVWRAVYDALEHVRPRSIAISDIQLIRDTDPSSIAAIEASHHRGISSTTRYRKSKLGSLSVEDVYIYQKPLLSPTLASVASEAARLMTKTGTFGAPLIILKDGTRMYAVPIEMHVTSDGGLEITWHDVDGDVNRSIRSSASRISTAILVAASRSAVLFGPPSSSVIFAMS